MYIHVVSCYHSDSGMHIYIYLWCIHICMLLQQYLMIIALCSNDVCVGVSGHLVELLMSFVQIELSVYNNCSLCWGKYLALISTTCTSILHILIHVQVYYTLYTSNTFTSILYIVYLWYMYKYITHCITLIHVQVYYTLYTSNTCTCILHIWYHGIVVWYSLYICILKVLVNKFIFYVHVHVYLLKVHTCIG